jgi:hypothetical protein
MFALCSPALLEHFIEWHSRAARQVSDRHRLLARSIPRFEFW